MIFTNLIQMELHRQMDRMCNKQILHGIQQIYYCQNSVTLNSLLLNESVSLQAEMMLNIFMGVSEVKNSLITLSVCNPRNTNFALFSQNSLIVQSSSFNVSLTDNILQGALVCTKCDLILQESTFIFVANGQNISGLIIEPIRNINIDQCFVQMRTNSVFSAGIVAQIKTVLTFYMSNSKISAYYFNLQEYNAVVAVVCQVQTTFEINKIKYYSNAPIFNDQSFVTMTQQPVKNPNICNNLNYLIYGICLEQLIYGQMFENTFQCVYPFEYNGIECKCAEGYILNYSYCVQIINQFTELEIHITNNISEIEAHLQSNITNLQLQIQAFTQDIDINLLQNTTTLDWRIYFNHTMLISSLQQMNNTILQKLSDLNSNMSLVNTTLITQLQNQQYTIEQRLLSNITNLNSNIQSQFASSYSNFTQNSQIQDQHIINNISLIQSIITSVNNTQNQLRDNLQTDLSSQIASLQSQIAALTAQVTANKNSVTNSISTLQSNLNSNTANLNAQISSQATSSQNSQNNLNNTIQVQINAIQNNINTLNTKMAGTIFKSISNVRNTCLQDVCYPCT
ncbi:Conserved_hypothetical protein [Hexamita inflata]|uniref:Uncharacterized protein n=1 Tax=Hexamita inflata TaxID=28002 RepID=A0AA86R2K6_9EUKA|nr:Conserved hypothetical protein [Hexamita inflata]CAI9965027.1 Conserved hypothetical protein [Hexamita inflata]